MNLSIPQQNIFDSVARFRTVSAGRRFGKTFLAMFEIAKIARLPNKRIFYVAPSYRMGKQIIWEDLKFELSVRKWVKKINESDLTITLKNGSRISIRSADNPDSMRGVSLDFIVLDEAAFMPKSVWTEVLRPTLSDRQGGALFISTPKGYNWFADMWHDAQMKDNWESFKYTTIEGGNVTAEEVEDAKQDLDLKTFKQEYEASFETAGNRIYYPFNVADSVKPFVGDVPNKIMLFNDMNVDPMAGCIVVQTKEGLHVIDELKLVNSNTDELAQEVINRYGNRSVTAFPDPAGAARKTSAGGRTDHTILMQYGFNVKVKRKHPAVKDRINAVNRLLQDAAGNRKLFIDPKCKFLIECLTKQQYKEGTQLPDKDSGYDHMNDALGYGVEYLYPVTKPVTSIDSPFGNTPTKRFGHF